MAIVGAELEGDLGAAAVAGRRRWRRRWWQSCTQDMNRISAAPVMNGGAILGLFDELQVGGGVGGRQRGGVLPGRRFCRCRWCASAVGTPAHEPDAGDARPGRFDDRSGAGVEVGEDTRPRTSAIELVEGDFLDHGEARSPKPGEAVPTTTFWAGMAAAFAVESAVTAIGWPSK